MALVKGMTPDKLTQKAAYTQNKANKLGLNLNDVTSFAGMSPEQSLNLIAKSRKELAGLSTTPTGNVVDMSNVNFGGITSTPNTPSTITAPTFNADTYYNNGANGINSIVDKKKELQLAEFRSARDKAVGDINYQKDKLPGEYQPLKDSTDFQAKTAAKRLSEIMADKGLGNSGKNVTEEMRINAANINALNTLNAQQQDQVNQYDRSITDLMNPDKENAINLAMDIERLQQLNDLRTRADDRAYDNDWRTADFNYRSGRDAVADNQWQTQFDYGKSRDLVADNQWQKTFDRGVFESDRGYKRDVFEYGDSKHEREAQAKVEQDRWLKEFAENQRQFNVSAAKSGGGGGGGGGGRGGGGSKKMTTSEMYALGAQMAGTRIGAFRTPYDFDQQLQREVAQGKLDPNAYTFMKKWIVSNYDDPNAVLPTWKKK